MQVQTTSISTFAQAEGRYYPCCHRCLSQHILAPTIPAASAPCTREEVCYRDISYVFRAAARLLTQGGHQRSPPTACELLLANSLASPSTAVIARREEIGQLVGGEDVECHFGSNHLPPKLFI